MRRLSQKNDGPFVPIQHFAQTPPSNPHKRSIGSLHWFTAAWGEGSGDSEFQMIEEYQADDLLEKD